MGLLSTIAIATLAARYQICKFSCPGEVSSSWQSCRAEKCTASLPEDKCPDGSDATPEHDAGEEVSGPLDCEERGFLRVGSFAERCELCMLVAQHAHDIYRKELSPSDGLAPDVLCERAVGMAGETLPTVRTCRLHGAACDKLLLEVQNRTCVDASHMISRGTTARALFAKQQELCGTLLSHRPGSGVSEAGVCGPPRDIPVRIFAISAVVASCLFFLQLGKPARFLF